MSGFEGSYPPPLSFDLPLPFPREPTWHPPPPSTQLALQQPFDWPLPSAFAAQPSPLRPSPPETTSHSAHGGLPGDLPVRSQSGQSGWGFPRGGAIHLPPDIPDELLPKHFAAGSELVKVTGKSCGACRTRKVKCDRRYPHCTRCIKRKETCDYGDDVSFALRPLVSLNRPKEQESNGSKESSPGASSTPTITTQQRISSSNLALPYPPPRIAAEASPARSLRTVSDFRHQLARRGVVDQEQEGEGRSGRQPEFQKLWDRFLDQSNLGESSSDWRLALPAMASSLTLHLLDASMNSCCYHLPAFRLFNPNIAYYKQNIDSLDVASRAAVGILTSLGARASPHSALLGVAGPDVENGNASHEVVLSAGVRRENAWRAIVKNATELCSKLEVLQVPSIINAQTLVAFVQMLMFSEVKPKTARFFLRAALGLFYDMQGGALPLHEVDFIKGSVGVPLYESDARIAAWLSLPCLISEDDLCDYFEGTGVHLVDLERENLNDQLATVFSVSRGPMSADKAEEALKITGFYVCAVQRLFAKISSSRRPSNRFLSSIEQLWEYIDGAHAACQLLTGTLRSFAMAQDDQHHSADHDLLIGLRMHERLLDVMNLSNEWLRSKRNDTLSPQDRNALEALLGVSNRRVRRCLKVLAFYAKVFHDSHDKHVVYHLFTQLEAVENWATMAAQGEDEVDEFGPLGRQCVLTETELDYFSQALELACFYTPLSAQRLEEFNRARRSRNQQALRFAAVGEYDLSSTLEPQYGSGRTSASPEHSPPQSRFPDIPNNEGQPSPANFQAARTLPYFSIPNTSAAYDQNQNGGSTEALSHWVLNRYANATNGFEGGTTNSESSTTSSPNSISPNFVVETDSSPDTISTLAGTSGGNSSNPGHQIDQPSSFFSPPLSTNRIQQSTSYPYRDPPSDLSFPASGLTNLARSLDFDYSIPTPNGYNRPIASEQGGSTPRYHSNGVGQNGGGGGGSFDSLWSNYSNWSVSGNCRRGTEVNGSSS